MDQSFSPADLHRIICEEIERGKQEYVDEVQKTYKQQLRKKEADELEAKSIVRQIPDKCRKAAAEGLTSTVVMGLCYSIDYERIGGNTLEASKLKGVAKIVYDFCKNAGLNLTIDYWWDDGGRDSGFNIVVHFA